MFFHGEDLKAEVGPAASAMVRRHPGRTCRSWIPAAAGVAIMLSLTACQSSSRPQAGQAGDPPSGTATPVPTALTTTTAPAPTPTSSATPASPGRELRNDDTGLCLGYVGDGEGLALASCQATADFGWVVSGGQIVNPASGDCVGYPQETFLEAVPCPPATEDLGSPYTVLVVDGTFTHGKLASATNGGLCVFAAAASALAEIAPCGGPDESWTLGQEA